MQQNTRQRASNEITSAVIRLFGPPKKVAESLSRYERGKFRARTRRGGVSSQLKGSQRRKKRRENGMAGLIPYCTFSSLVALGGPVIALPNPPEKISTTLKPALRQETLPFLGIPQSREGLSGLSNKRIGFLALWGPIHLAQI